MSCVGCQMSATSAFSFQNDETMNQKDTPPKTNLEPENGGPLEKEIPMFPTIICRFHVKFRGVRVETSNIGGLLVCSSSNYFCDPNSIGTRSRAWETCQNDVCSKQPGYLEQRW